MKKLHSWWRRRGNFLYLAGQLLNSVVLEQLWLGCQLPPRPSEPFKAWFLCFHTRLCVKYVGKVITFFHRGERTSPPEKLVDFCRRRSAAHGLVRFVLLGWGSILSRSLRPLLCSRQVSKTRSASALVSDHCQLLSKPNKVLQRKQQKVVAA